LKKKPRTVQDPIVKNGISYPSLCLAFECPNQKRSLYPFYLGAKYDAQKG